MLFGDEANHIGLQRQTGCNLIGQPNPPDSIGRIAFAALDIISFNAGITDLDAKVPHLIIADGCLLGHGYVFGIPHLQAAPRLMSASLHFPVSPSLTARRVRWLLPAPVM